MAFSKFAPLAGSVYEQNSVAATAVVIDTTDGVDFMGIQIDNSNNSDITFLKVYDNDSPTIGTTNPVMQFAVPAGAKRSVSFHVDDSNATTFGIDMTNGLSIAAVTEGGVSGSTSPSKSVPVELITS